MVRTRTPSGSSEINIPQVEVILTHSLVCRKTRREFIVGSDPDASFVANLAKHIRQMQPGTQMAKANSLLCIFCNSPYTYEDYLRHIQPSMDTILVSCNLISLFFLKNFGPLLAKFLALTFLEGSKNLAYNFKCYF